MLEVVKKYTPEEAEGGRQQVLESKIAPNVKDVFDLYPKLKSAVMFVAQFQEDKPTDEIEIEIAFSISDDPDYDSWLDYMDSDVDRKSFLESKQYFIEGKFGAKQAGFKTKPDDPIDLPLWQIQLSSYEDIIPLFSSYCRGSGIFEDGYRENFSPFAIFRRGQDESDIEIEIIGEQLRPWLDGVMPLGEQYRNELPEAEAYATSLRSSHKGPVLLEKAVWSKAEGAAGGVILGVQNALDKLLGPEPEEPAKPVSEYDVLKYTLAVFVLIFLVMSLMTFAGFSFPTE